MILSASNLDGYEIFPCARVCRFDYLERKLGNTNINILEKKKSHGGEKLNHGPKNSQTISKMVSAVGQNSQGFDSTLIITRESIPGIGARHGVIGP